MADIVGPTLEQLDNWGNIDTLPYSLDNAIWLTAALREGESTPSVSASVTSDAIRIVVGAATPSTSASVSAEGIRICSLLKAPCKHICICFCRRHTHPVWCIGSCWPCNYGSGRWTCCYWQCCKCPYRQPYLT